MLLSQPLPVVLTSVHNGRFWSGFCRLLRDRIPHFERKSAEPAEALPSLVFVQAGWADEREFQGFSSYVRHVHTLALNRWGKNLLSARRSKHFFFSCGGHLW